MTPDRAEPKDRVRDLADRFDEAWQRGAPPRIEDFLRDAHGSDGTPLDETARRELLEELVKLDLEYRWRGQVPVDGATVSWLFLEDYAARLPELGPPERLPVALIAEEYRVRHRYGDRPSSHHYAERFPHHGPALAAALRAVDDSLHQQPAVTPRPESPAAPLPSLPDYEVLGILGRGGMGVVYKARQARADRVVALKMILTGEHASEAELARFRTEAEAVARLQHPNILQVFQVGEHNGLPFFSLEFCAGGSLADQLDGTPWPAVRAAALVETLARAVHAAHERQVIHRDLKPANVLLVRSDPLQGVPMGGPDESGHYEHYTPKVADFGLAKKLDAPGHPTSTGAVMGTPSYMAPEQARGHNDAVGPAADVYALGAILYELLTGRPPFKAATSMETLLQVLSDEPLPPSRFHPKLPRDAETICLKCLQKDARKRYASAQELADDLRRFLNHEPIRARPVGALGRGWRWCRRNPALAAAVLTLLAATVVSSLFALDANSSAAKARQEKQEADRARGTADEQTRLAKQKEAEANDSAKKAQDQKKIADDARQLAEGKKREADAARQQAERQSRRAEWLLYARQTALAQLSWDDNNLARAHGFLEECRWDFRGWEHAYLRRLFEARQRTLLGHGAAVTGVAFGPDGSWVVSGSEDGTIRVWDVATGKEVRRLEDGGDIRCLALSRDGRRLASGGYLNSAGPPNTFDKQVVKVWDLTTGKLVLRLQPAARVHCLAFSPDGKRLASGGGNNGLFGTANSGELRLWDATTGKEVLAVKNLPDNINSVAFSPDGKRLAVARGADNWFLATLDVRVLDAATGQDQVFLQGNLFEPPASPVLFSPDGQRLLGGNRVWDAATGRKLLSLTGDTWKTAALAQSHDGQWIVTGSSEGTLRVWDAAKGQVRQLLKGHRGSVTHVVFSPDGKLLASGSRDTAVKLWDLTAPEEPLTIKAPAQGKALALSSDGRRLAAGGVKAIQVWDTTTGRDVWQFKDLLYEVEGLAFSPDGKHLAGGGSRYAGTGGKQVGEVALWDAAMGKKLRTFQELEDSSVPGVMYSPDGRRVAAVLRARFPRHGEVVVWEAATGRQLLTCRGASQEMDCAAFSPDGKQIVTASGGGPGSPAYVQIWDAESGRELHSLLRRDRSIRKIAFSPDGRRLAWVEWAPDFYKSGANRKPELIVWDVAAWQQERALAGHADVANSVTFSPDGTRLFSSSSDGTAKVWDTQTWQEVLTLSEPKGWIYSLTLSADGTRLAARVSEGTMVKVWNGTPLPDVVTFRGHEKPVHAVAVSPDGSRVVSCEAEIGVPGEVKVWDAFTRHELLGLRGTGRAFTCVLFSADGKRLIAGSFDAKVRVLDAVTGQEVAAWAGNTNLVTGVAASADGKHILGAGLNGAVKLWHAATGQELLSLEKQAGGVRGVACRPDGKQFALAGRDGAVHLYDAATGEPIRTLKGHGKEVMAVAYRGDGKRLVSGGQDGTVRLWDADTGQQLLTLSGHTREVISVAFRPDGSRVAGGGADGTVREWDADTGQGLLTLRGHTAPVSGVCYGAEEKALVSGSQDGTVRIWYPPRALTRPAAP
jgi:WD40 repeat protein/serine/threonine protein kinase